MNFFPKLLIFISIIRKGLFLWLVTWQASLTSTPYLSSAKYIAYSSNVRSNGVWSVFASESFNYGRLRTLVTAFASNGKNSPLSGIYPAYNSVKAVLKRDFPPLSPTEKRLSALRSHFLIKNALNFQELLFNVTGIECCFSFLSECVSVRVEKTNDRWR